MPIKAADTKLSSSILPASNTQRRQLSQTMPRLKDRWHLLAGLWLNIPDYDAPTQMVKPKERNTRYVNAVMTIPKVRLPHLPEFTHEYCCM